MKYLLAGFIIFFTVFNIYFKDRDQLNVSKNFQKDVSFEKKTFNIDKRNNKGKLYEYFKVEKNGGDRKETLIYVNFNKDHSWNKHEVYSGMVATAYTPGPESCGIYADGFTYTEMVADYGIIAVDPRYIDLGSIVYVEDYGFAYAADIGGKIKGRRIDLCFLDVDTALKFGVKKVDLIKIF